MEPKEMLEEILDGHKIISEKDKDTLYLPKDMPELINSGDTQSIVRLDGKYVGKIATLKISNHLFVNRYEGDIKESTENWRELGFNVPEHIFYTIIPGDKISLNSNKSENERYSVAITPDLSENGKYEVITYDQKKIATLKNFGELYGKYHEGFSKIKDIEANPGGKYALQAVGHLEEDGSLDKAIRHMFLVQIDTENKTGKLYLGDVDHLLIYK